LSDDLHKKPGYLALRHEMRVRKILEQRGWRATHGPYYTDPREGKERELDVSATRVWTTKREIRAHVTLLVECKAGKSAQLLARQRNVRTPDPLYYHWIGLDDPDLRKQIRDIVDASGMKMRGIMPRLESTLYPRGAAIVKPLLVNAPAAPCRASATREVDREESGATWDATQQVFAAMNGTIAVESAAELEEIRDGLSLRQSPADDTIDYAARVLRMAAADVLLFHPIVSIESPLMLVSESGELTNVPWCRVERARVLGVDRQWIDVVNAAAFEEYAATLTAWYERVLSSK